MPIASGARVQVPLGLARHRADLKLGALCFEPELVVVRSIVSCAGAIVCTVKADNPAPIGPSCGDCHGGLERSQLEHTVDRLGQLIAAEQTIPQA